MNAPRVSVVIPTYNYGHFVVDAVKSVLAQTYTDYEVIVVDDGSTDDTRARLAPLFDRIRYVYQENQGLSAARNRGIAEARGVFIGLLDSDDQWHSRFLELLLPWLERDPALAMVGAAATSAEPPPEEIDERQLKFAEVSVESFVTSHPLLPSAVLIRRNVFDAVGMFDTSLRSVEDRDMWIRIALVARVGHLNGFLAWYRVHASSMSAAANSRRMEHFDRLVLHRAFEQTGLRGRRILRRQAFSILNWRAAIAYREAGDFRQGWLSVCRAIVDWPFPYAPAVTRWRLPVRLRFVAKLVLMHLKSLFRTALPAQRQAPDIPAGIRS